MKRIFTLILAVSTLVTKLNAQTYTLNSNLGTINTCGGTFLDSGGSGSDYGGSEDYSVTFCPSVAGEVVRLSFSQFCIRISGGSPSERTCQDLFMVYQGDAAYAVAADAAAVLAGFTYGADDTYCGTVLPTIVANNASGCITIRFVSTANQHECGWNATLSCQTPCSNPTAALVDASPVTICPGSALNPGNPVVSFNASASTLGGYAGVAGYSQHTIDQYSWNWGDGTTSTTATATTTHTYSTPGVYKMTLSVNDNNTDFISPTGCTSTNAISRDIYVVPPPAVNSPTATVACGSCATLNAQGETRTEAETPPVITVTPTVLPDGNGTCYTNSVDYSGYFPAGATLDASCRPSVCFNISHSWAADLIVTLIAPDGKSMRLYNRHYTATAIKFGTCTDAIDGNPEGCPASYCISTDGTGASWTSTGQVTTSTSTCAAETTCETGNYFKGGTYNPSDPWTNLNGAPLNGTWTLRICDQQSLDDGTLHSWNMTFPSSCYKELNEISPSISTVTWDSGVTSTGGSTTNIQPAPGDPCPSGQDCDGTRITNTGEVCYPNPTTAGTYNYSFTVTDEYGCQYPGTAAVTVTCLLNDDNFSFDAKNEGAVNVLRWRVFSTEGVQRFAVERMTDDSEWTTLDYVSVSSANAYLYNDATFEKGHNYYRIKLINTNGTESYSRIFVIANQSKVKKVKSVYNVYGQEISRDTKGLKIIYYEDGSIDKVYE